MLTLVTEMSGPALIVVPAMKLDPVRVTATVAPCTAAFGAMFESTGAGGLTVNVTGAEMPPLVVTVTLAAPRVVFAVMVKVAVIWVALATLTLLTVMPVPALTEAPATKLEPVRATATAAPCAPELGAMAVNVGAGGL